MSRKIALKEAKRIGDRLGICWNFVELSEFRQGLEVEQEHWQTVDRNMTKVALIALDHLAEIPDYYTRLKLMEEEARRVWDKRLNNL